MRTLGELTPWLNPADNENGADGGVEATEEILRREILPHKFQAERGRKRKRRRVEGEGAGSILSLRLW